MQNTSALPIIKSYIEKIPKKRSVLKIIVMLLLLPLVLLRWLLGLIIMRMIFPAPLLRSSHNAEVDASGDNFEHKKIFIPSLGDLYYFEQTTTQKDKSLSERKILLMFGGNCFNAKKTYKDYNARLKLLDADIVMLDQPAHMTSTRTLIDNAKKTIQGLLDSGVKPENLTIHGFSLGGAIALIALSELKMENATFPNIANFIHDGSFMKLEEVILSSKIACFFAKWLILKPTACADLTITEAHLNNIPANSVHFCYLKNDSVIPARTAVRGFVKANRKKLPKSKSYHTYILDNGTKDTHFPIYVFKDDFRVRTSVGGFVKENRKNRVKQGLIFPYY